MAGWRRIHVGVRNGIDAAALAVMAARQSDVSMQPTVVRALHLAIPRASGERLSGRHTRSP
jgi:hypothetical protein